MNQVFVCGTYFHVYISILRIVLIHNDSQKLLILNTLTPGIGRLIPDLLTSKFFNHCIQVPFREISLKMKGERSLWNRIFSRKRRIVRCVDAASDLAQYDNFIQQAEINIFHHIGMSASYFISKYPKNKIRMLEDGTRNYIGTLTAIKYFKRKYILNTFIGEGHDEEIKEICVQFPERLHPRIRFKGINLNLKAMQGQMSAEDNEKILRMFMGGHCIDLSGNKKLILITQPFSEDNYVTEEYKVNLYAQILEKYSADYQLFVKPHPRETTNYKTDLNRSVIEIPRTFPLEMFDLMENIKFDKGITISSGGITNVNCIAEKIILGNECLKNACSGKTIL